MFALLEAHIVANVLSNVAELLEVVALRFNVWVRQFYVLMGEPLILTFANRFFHLDKRLTYFQRTKEKRYSTNLNIGLIMVYVIN